MTDSVLEALLELRDVLRHRAVEGDWEWFRAPKNLATALNVASAEIVQPFQWLTEAEASGLSLKVRERIVQKMADLLLYLVLLADELDLELAAVSREVSTIHREICPAE